MSDRIKKIKIKQSDGTFSDYIPIGANAKDVDMANGYSLENTIGTIDVDKEGSIKTQLSKTTKYYDSVADMKADTQLTGAAAVTLGYYKPNDGGGALYQIIDSTDEDYESLVDDGGSAHDLKNNLKAKLIVKDSINVKQFGAYGDGEHDDTNAFNKSISYGNNILIPIGEFLVTDIIIDKDNKSFIGEDKKNSILIAHSIIFEDNGNIILNNFTFDGKDNSQGITFLRSSNVTIDNCNFINITNKDLKLTKAISFIDTINGVISNCLFNNIYASDENGIEGTDDIGVCRAIHTYGAEKVSIIKNYFSNIIGEEDTDIIHISAGTKGEIDENFPFLGMRHGYDFQNLIKDNIFYVSKVKSVIKVQCDDTEISNNSFFINNSTNRILAVIRVQAGEHHIINNNYIEALEGSENLAHIIYYHTCANSIVSNNIIKIRGNKNVGGNDYSAIFLCSRTDNISFIKNILEIGNYRHIIYLRGNTNTFIEENDIKVLAKDYGPTLLRIATAENSEIQNNLFFRNNHYVDTELATTRGLLMQIENGEELHIEYNKLHYIRTFEPIRMQFVENFYFENNLLDNPTDGGDGVYYPIVFADEANNLYCRYNTVTNEEKISALFRAYNILHNFHISAAYETDGKGIYYLQSSQDKSEITYYDTKYKMYSVDVGWTPESINYQNGHTFFVYGTNKTISYYNSKWYNNDGTEAEI